MAVVQTEGLLGIKAAPYHEKGGGGGGALKT